MEGGTGATPDAKQEPEYNAGEQDDRRAAMAAATDYAKLLVTLATGAVLFTATFLDRIFTGHDQWMLLVAWLLLAFSVFFGTYAIGSHISQLAESDLRARRSAIENACLAQFVALVLGAGFFAAFVVRGIDAAPAVAIDAKAVTVSRSGEVRLIATCASARPGGCVGTARLDWREDTVSAGPFKTSGAFSVRLAVSRPICRALARGDVKVTIVVNASDRDGKTTQKRAEVDLPKRGRCVRS
ncbi:MAG TPA: hypothetical protein VF529_00970 [Solirubrobacteraceae bacterium]